jgi:hypothetical protein
MTVSSETLRSISAPDKLESRLGTLEFVNGVPRSETVETVYDHLDYVHALNVYLNGFAAPRHTRSARASTMRERPTTKSSCSRSCWTRRRCF